ncbi:hypothetical protein [Granulicella sp. S190]|uniref:hypothetical protein n=1 Tax=Granulicella sp. S190 TaxID=1747226 RepID=UPI00131BDCA2|nr:hypothetical protein [Granulicella sp. S190]
MTKAAESNGEKGKTAVLTENMSVGDLFSLVTGGETESDIKAGLGAEELTELRKKVPKMVSWTSVQEGVSDSLAEAMHISVLATLANGWKHYKVFMEDVKRSRSNPEVEIVSAIADHAIHSTLHPYVDVKLGGKTVHEIAFDVGLVTTIRGLLLGLKNGEIVSVELGECEWAGKIAVAEVEVLERKLKKLTLPGHLRLKRGIPIPIN